MDSNVGPGVIVQGVFSAGGEGFNFPACTALRDRVRGPSGSVIMARPRVR